MSIIICTSIQKYNDIRDSLILDGYEAAYEEKCNNKTVWLETETDCVVLECEPEM